MRKVLLGAFLALLLVQPAAAHDRGTLDRYAEATWRSFAAMTDAQSGLPPDILGRDGTRSGRLIRPVHGDARTSCTREPAHRRHGPPGSSRHRMVLHPQRHRQRRHVDPGADCRIRRIGDAGGGQDQPELQVEPWRGDLGADRARGRLQKLKDFFRGHVHRQIS